MVHFPYSPPPERVRLGNDLDFIRNHSSNQYQCQLLDKRARKLFDRYWWTPGRGDRVQQVLSTVEEIRREMSNIVPAGSPTDPDIQIHEQCCEIIQRGYANMNGITSRSSRRVNADDLKENDAISRDRVIIEEAIQLQRSRQPPVPLSVRVFKMDSPSDEPHIISENFRVYREMLFYLSNTGIVLMPELWIRQHKQHNLTKNGYRWQHVHGPERVEASDLDVVDVQERKDYIVALAHEKSREEESPVPLDVHRVGDKACCDPPCGNLRNHMRHLWGNRIVIQARRFSDDANDTVLSTALDTTLFLPRTNDLYLQWEPAPCVSFQPASPS